MLNRLFILMLAHALSSASAMGEDATGVLERFRTVSGGERWNEAHSWHGEGTIRSGGLNGEYAVSVDLLTGRSVDTYRLGPLDGADGYDGRTAWSRDPGGEAAALDAPEAVRHARSQAWLDAHAYWYPQRTPATYSAVEVKEAAGRRYAVVVASPREGDPVTLWFAADSGLLAQVQQRQGQDTATTLFDDYRDVDGVRMPFHCVIDMTDAAGRTDSRRRVEIQLERITLNVALADSDFAQPALTATARIDDPGGITRLPFELLNNHIYALGTLDGQPARFMVDTGGFNLLTPAAAKKFGLHSEGRLPAAGVGEERGEFAAARAHEVRLGAAAMSSPVFYVTDLGQLQDVEGTALDGLVGYEMFRRFGTQIDYGQRQLTISDPAKFTPPAGATAVSFDLADSVPIVNATIDGLPARISIDTGSRSALTLHSPFVRAHDLVAKYRAGPETVIGWGVGGAVRGRPVRLGTLQLGDLGIQGIAGELFTGDKGSFANPDLAGNLGGGALNRFTVAFDYANKKMYLAPNAHFGRADTFDRSGLWLLADGDALRVADVAAGSAAALAGLRNGDRILAIGDADIARFNLSAWRVRLRDLPAGYTLDVRFRRDGAEQSATLRLADRIPASYAP